MARRFGTLAASRKVYAVSSPGSQHIGAYGVMRNHLKFMKSGRSLQPSAMHTVFCFTLIIGLPSLAQQTSTLSKRAAAVQQQAAQLAPHDKISVVRYGSPEEFGNFLSRTAQDFTFYDIDLKTAVTLPYPAIKKIKRGYGGYNGLHHKHVDRDKDLLIVAIAIAGLGALIGAAATARN